MGKRKQAKVAAAAAGFIGPTEPVRAAVFAQDIPLRGWRLMRQWRAGRVTWLVVAVTDRHIYLFRRGFRANADLRSVLRRYPIAATPMELISRKGELVIGEGSCWVTSLATLGRARDLVSFVHQRQRDERDRAERAQAPHLPALRAFVVNPSRSQPQP
jgi:hypothetical protein